MRHAARDRENPLGRDHLDPETLARLIEGSETALNDAEWRHLATCVDCHAAYADALRTLHSWHAGASALPAPKELLAAGRGIPGAVPRASGRDIAGARSPASGRRIAGEGSPASGRHIAGGGSPSAARRRRSRGSASRLTLQLGGAAVAASLACILLLPPRAASPPPLWRGGEETGFVRPIEGEILWSGPRQMEWQEVAGATQYLVQLRDEEGREVWEGNTDRTRIRLPASVRLVCGRGYKALLAVWPPDLNPPGGTSVAFRVGSAWDCALQRARRPDLRALLLGIAGLGLICLGTVTRRLP